MFITFVFNIVYLIVWLYSFIFKKGCAKCLVRAVCRTPVTLRQVLASLPTFVSTPCGLLLHLGLGWTCCSKLTRQNIFSLAWVQRASLLIFSNVRLWPFVFDCILRGPRFWSHCTLCSSGETPGSSNSNSCDFHTPYSDSHQTLVLSYNFPSRDSQQHLFQLSPNLGQDPPPSSWLLQCLPWLSFLVLLSSSLPAHDGVLITIPIMPRLCLRFYSGICSCCAGQTQFAQAAVSLFLLHRSPPHAFAGA